MQRLRLSVDLSEGQRIMEQDLMLESREGGIQFITQQPIPPGSIVKAKVIVFAEERER